jgi:hypothetical protein
MFARQAGKDEALANLLVFFLSHYHRVAATAVFASPTFKPQTINAMLRLEQRLDRNLLTTRRWKRRAGYIFQLGQSSVTYFSAEPSANVVGATASHLLIINEAQDIQPAIYDKRFAPMAAAGNATRVFAGTAWTSDSLLARELASARTAEKSDGRRRVFQIDAEEVGAEVEPYAEFVRSEIARLGRDHPLIKTQYYNETIDAQASMFSPAMLAAMDAGPATPGDTAGSRVLTIDVAGQGEGSPDPKTMTNPARDQTTLDIASLDLSSLDTLRGPTYHITGRHAWTGTNHLQIFGQIQAIAQAHRPQYIVIDATGVGEGLWAMLDAAFPGIVIPVKFSSQKKSELGWRFLAMANTGRIRDHRRTTEIHQQYLHCRSEILPGPAKTLRWGVPDGTRNHLTGELIHDDYVLADALLAEIDLLPWSAPSDTAISPAADPIQSMERNF